MTADQGHPITQSGRKVLGSSRSDDQGEKLRCTRTIADTTLVDAIANVWAAAPAGVKVVAPPLKAERARSVYCSSRPTSRFLTGFHTVREPICQAAQSAQPRP